MGGLIHAIFGGGGNNDAAQEQQIQQQQAQITADQGQQLRLISQQQATQDQSTADMEKLGIGRAMLAYNKVAGGLSNTLGG